MDFIFESKKENQYIGSELINLDEKSYISEGSQRIIYAYPEYPDRCIKILKNKKNRSVDRELFYLKKYRKLSNSISKFHGKINTNLGLGYIFDLIRNDDGSISKTLASEVHNIENDNLKFKIHSLYIDFIDRKIVVSDMHSSNILVRYSDVDFDLYLIDGVGNSDYIKICDYSRWFLKKKLRRKFNRLSKSLDISIDFN